VVDDNLDAARTLALMVKMFDHEVRIAHDGEEAIQTAAEFLPEVILMDIGMPRMNGYDAARSIRQQSWGQSMTLVALTGWGKRRIRSAQGRLGLIIISSSRRIRPNCGVYLMAWPASLANSASTPLVRRASLRLHTPAAKEPRLLPATRL
jgi:CheY-like chemotaxis protein